jgi:hypothetical protein
MSVRNMIGSPHPSFARDRQARASIRMDKDVCDVLLSWRYCSGTTAGLRSIMDRYCHTGSDRTRSALCACPAKPSRSIPTFQSRPCENLLVQRHMSGNLLCFRRRFKAPTLPCHAVLDGLSSSPVSPSRHVSSMLILRFGVPRRYHLTNDGISAGSTQRRPLQQKEVTSSKQ